MNCLSLNSCTICSLEKRNWVRDLCNSHRVMFLGLQETRMTRVDLFQVRGVWGNQNFDFISSCARGRSGGILSVWDPTLSQTESFVCTDNFIIVKGRWTNLDLQCFMVNVYSPQSIQVKKRLWDELREFILHHPRSYILFRDFNVVRNAEKRSGSVFCHLSATHFTDFIFMAGLS